MFDYFKQKKDDRPLDVKSIRHKILQFIKEQLQRWEGGEGSQIKSLQLFLAPSPEEVQLYESVVYFEEEGRFREEEVQKIADDYAIELPSNWLLDIRFSAELPPEAVMSKELPVAIHIATNKKPVINKPSIGRITVLLGEAEKMEYTITANDGKICIGRDRQAKTPEGFMRVNNIAFPGESKNDSNKFISRQHAHIEWDPEAGCFFLYADEGGIPPRNKVKVMTSDGVLIKLQTMDIGHPLQDDDQIVLGETALIQFNYKDNE